MWRPWGKASCGGATASPRLNPTFSFSTFKDVGTLLRDDDSCSSASASASLSPARKASVFHRVRIASAAVRAWRSSSPHLSPSLGPAVEDKRIVLYFTSLRVVRKTFEDCRAVRSILRGFRVAVDERDLSMDSCFMSELEALLGRRPIPALPQVFIGGRWVGGADEIRHLHETGELKRIVEGAPPAAPGSCKSCGGVRFLLCPSCCGSHKCFSDKGGGFRCCAACNENGLVRCPDCSTPAAAAA